MTFDLEKILQSKRDMRRNLAALPVEEKLAMLDALRERALALRSATLVLKVPSGFSREKAGPRVGSSH
jgi:hypothetical protein